MKNIKEYDHNKGEKDGAKNEHNPPYSGIEVFVNSFIASKDEIKKQGERNDAYEKGYKNAKNQR